MMGAPSHAAFFSAEHVKTLSGSRGRAEVWRCDDNDSMFGTKEECEAWAATHPGAEIIELDTSDPGPGWHVDENGYTVRNDD